MTPLILPMHADAYPVNRLPCANCQGQGFYTCDICHGDGHFEAICTDCNGKGEKTFVVCDSKNLIPCGDCKDDIDPATGEKCKTCNGTAQVPSCVEFTDKCNTCNGEGIRDTVCEECHDSGRIICRTCRGQEYIEVR